MKHNRMLVMDNVFYRYRKGEFELRSINIDTTDKNTVCLLGNSGCGKSTILSLIMGLTRVDSGRIVIDNVCLDDGKLFVQPERRNIGVVFQHPSLFPHRTIIENIMFAIKDLDTAKKKISAMEVLEIFNLGCFADSYPHMLSGGQQQMVTIARAIAQKPKIILMDEPFSSLDFMLRRSTRRKVFEILKSIKTQAILVTHDPEEAVENADFIYVVNKGRIIQGASPDSIYADPGSKYVMNLFDELSCMKIKVEGSVLRTPFGVLDKQHSFSPGSEVEVCFGSDAFVVSDFGQDVIVENHCLFSKYLWFRLDGNVYKMAYSFDNNVPEIGKTIKVTLKKERVFAFPV